MRVSSMIAANALLAKDPWNRLKPSLSKSYFAKEVLSLLQKQQQQQLEQLDDNSNNNILLPPDNVIQALRAPDSQYDASVLTASRWINELLQSNMGMSNSDSSPSDAVYTPPTLQHYDLWVWHFNAPFLWRIHMEEVKGLYNDCVLHSQRHAEVAVGTGLFLRELNVPETLLKLDLIDSNSHSLEVCETSLRSHPHYEYSQVQIKSYQYDILDPTFPPPSLQNQYDSVGANFILHCLHGGASTTHRALDSISKLLHPARGVLFGTTILGQTILNDNPSFVGSATLETLQLYNEWGLFGNMQHDYATLDRVLHELFEDVEIWRTGYCAAWKARRPKQQQ